MDNCSLDAFKKIRESGYLAKTQAMYLAVFKRSFKPLTHREVQSLVETTFNRKVHIRSGRVAELENMGMIRKFDTIECPITRMKVNRWVSTDRETPKRKIKTRTSCTRCKGSGVVEKIDYTDLTNPEYMV